MEQAPGIGVNPSPADRARYNAWADRNGQPHLGGGAAVAPMGRGRGRGRGRGAAAPIVPGRGRGNWGAPVPALPAHGVNFAPDANAGGWQRGSNVIHGRTEYAMTSAGQRRVLRVRNTRTDSWTWKAAGRDYYDHNRQRFIINIPCLGYIGPHVAGMEPTHGHDMNDPSDRADYERYGPVLLRSSFYGHFHSERIIPLTDAQVWVGTVPAEHEGNPNMAPEGPNLLDLANIGVIHDQDHDQATIEAALRTRVAEFLMNLPEFNTVDGRKHRLRVESTIVWMWDESKPITFDEQIIRNMHGEGPPLIETLMNRPLLGVPCVNERMYGRMGLCPLPGFDGQRRVHGGADR